MTEPILFSLGLPHGRWADTAVAWHRSVGLTSDLAGTRLHTDVLPLAELDRLTPALAEAAATASVDPSRLSAWLGGADSGMGAVDARLCWTAAPLAALLPGAQVLIWVESPSSAMARWLASASQDADEAAAWALLQSAAEHLSQLAARLGPQGLVVSLDEALAQPQAFQSRLAAWLGRPLPAPAWAAVAPVPAPLERLMQPCLAQEPGLRRAHERLAASCVILDESAGLPEPAAPASTLELLQSLRGLQQGSIDPKVLADLQQRLELAQGESGQLQAALHQAQEELVQAQVRVQSTLAQAQKAAAAAEPAATAVSEALARDNELLIIQLHHLQEELEQYFLEQQGRAPAAGSAPPLLTDLAPAVPQEPATEPGALRAVRTEVGAARDEAPHRELGLALQGLSVAGRQMDRLELRLVEHHGRPGLLLLDSRSPVKPLLAWQPTGQESGRDFMLLVPEDDASRELIQRLGTTDWQLVQALAAHLARHLASASRLPSPRWAVLAQRLVLALSALPARLRYDQLSASADVGHPAAALLTLQRPSFADRQADGLGLRWHARPDGGTPLELLRGEDQTDLPLLKSWPADDDGRWAARWALPVGNTPAQAAAWQRLPREDRQFLLALLEALPAGAQCATDAGVASAAGLGSPQQAAGQLLRQALQQEHGSRLRRVWRAARGRLPR